MWKEEIFTISIDSLQYIVEPISCIDFVIRYKVSTQHHYLFTLFMNEKGNWQAENDVRSIDLKLAEEVIKKIENHDA